MVRVEVRGVKDTVVLGEERGSLGRRRGVFLGGEGESLRSQGRGDLEEATGLVSVRVRRGETGSTVSASRSAKTE